MTDLDITAIRERRANATPGAWWREGRTQYVYAMAKGGRPNGEGIVSVGYYGKRRENWDADTEFIANAPADIDALLAEMERLQGELAEVADLLGHLPILSASSDIEPWAKLRMVDITKIIEVAKGETRRADWVSVSCEQASKWGHSPHHWSEYREGEKPLRFSHFCNGEHLPVPTDGAENFTVACSIDHSETGGEKAGAVVDGPFESREEAERQMPALADAYPQCSLTIVDGAEN